MKQKNKEKIEAENKIITMAYYLLENNSTIRATGKEFGIPKSTVHHKLNTELKYINYHLYRKVKKLLEHNFKIKHLRGGESTKQKYMALNKNINCNDYFENK